jgi:hypothetical protein
MLTITQLMWLQYNIKGVGGVMVFKNISLISWGTGLLVEETDVPRENQ